MIKENCDEFVIISLLTRRYTEGITGWELCIDDLVLIVINTEKEHLHI